MNSQPDIIAIHGFLGKPSDWDIVEEKNVIKFDLNQFKFDSLEAWAAQFNDYIRSNFKKPVLLGYSLGGRLALHALIAEPSLYNAGVIISAHPGLKNKKEKERRLEEDLNWANRFENENWNELMDAWNKRAAFTQGLYTFKREEKDYDRKQLAHLLRVCSLGEQANLRPGISRLSLPLLWMTGENDKTYTEIAQTVTLKHPDSRAVILPEAGHRAPWDQPLFFNVELKSFLIQFD